MYPYQGNETVVLMLMITLIAGMGETPHAFLLQPYTGSALMLCLRALKLSKEGNFIDPPRSTVPAACNCRPACISR